MSAARARKIMIAAIAISLLLHLILAGYIPWPFNRPSPQSEVVKVRTITIARIPQHTPPPVPTAAPKPRALPAIKTKVVPPKTTSRGTKALPVARAVPPSAGTASATPIAASATPAATSSPQPCADRDISPVVTATSAPVEIPPDARASKASGVAAISVQIDPQGHVAGATVAHSSGNPGLDGVAVQMAKSATYAPALVKCKPVASVYTYTVKFAAW